MKLSPILLLAGAGIGYYIFRNKFRTAKNLTYQFDTIGLTSANLRSIKGYIKIKLFNPDKGVITLNQIAGNISIDGGNTFNFSSDQRAELQPNTTTTAVINFEISVPNLALQAVPIVRKILSGGSLEFLVTGFIDTNVGRLSFTKNFNTRKQ
jgi:hypothetical protein